MRETVARAVWWGVGASVVAFTAWLANQSAPHAHAASAGRDAEAPVTPASAASSPSAGAGAGVATADASMEMVMGGDGGDSLTASMFFDASVVREMPAAAPRLVHIGVVLVQFEGAEGASSSARAKKDALAEATRLLDLARTDWKAAVKAGDSGSAEDIGRIPRGVLDARTEIATFSLGAGEISDVVETPKGFWIVKRID